MLGIFYCEQWATYGFGEVVLRCIICRCKQTTINALGQISILCQGLVKYRKVNGITPMTTHVQTKHPKLFALRKQQLSAMAKPIAHV
jgi:hypothetical protein